MERHMNLSLLSVRTEVSDWLMYHMRVTSNFSIIWGALHSTKLSGLKFRVFHATN